MYTFLPVILALKWPQTGRCQHSYEMTNVDIKQKLFVASFDLILERALQCFFFFAFVPIEKRVKHLKTMNELGCSDDINDMNEQNMNQLLLNPRVTNN